MGLQEATTHDFLSLYTTKGKVHTASTLIHHQDQRQLTQQGFMLKTHNFLQPLENKTTGVGSGGGGGGSGSDSSSEACSEEPFSQSPPGTVSAASTRPPDINTSPAALPPLEHGQPIMDRMLHGGVGTYTISHVPSSNTTLPTVVKSEWPTPTSSEVVTVAGWMPTGSIATANCRAGVAGLRSLANGKDLPQVSLPSVAAYADKGAGAFSLWGDSPPIGDNAAKELTVRVDGKSNTSDQKPSTPRSKHSATEQRRRSKINDRFQILRNLIPNTDQKRDKASFLLEVIEYIQFLQEKVQRFENMHLGQNRDNPSVPWKVSNEGTSGSSQVPQNDPTPHGCVNSSESTDIGAPVVKTGNQIPLEPENVSSGVPSKPSVLNAQQFASCCGLAHQHQRMNMDPDSVAYQPQGQAVRIGNDILGQQELTIDDGTISISSVCSQGILNALAHALQSSGVDLSQASVSVQINLGRRAFSRPASVPYDQQGPSSGNQVIGHSRSRSSREELEKAKKRQKPNGN